MPRPKTILTINGRKLDVPILVPSSKTLARYGLSYKEWKAILVRQGGVCPICETVPSTGRLVVDHEHVLGWKKLPPSKRKLYVRGLLCSWCNYRMIPRTSTPSKLRNAAQYLDLYLEIKTSRVTMTGA